MPAWEVYLTETSEVERDLTGAALRRGIETRRFGPDDMIRPSGTNERWTPLRKVPGLPWPEPLEDEPSGPTPPPAPAAQAPPPTMRRGTSDDEAPPTVEQSSASIFDSEASEVTMDLPNRQGAAPPPLDDDDFEVLDEAEPAPASPGDSAVALPVAPATLPEPSGVNPASPEDSAVALPVARPTFPAASAATAPPPTGMESPASTAASTSAPPTGETLLRPFSHAHDNELGDDEEDPGFTLGGEEEKPEELDLTAMVDVAFQLILFFLVTATTIYFKSLEIPNPDPEKDKTAQQAPQTLDDLENTNILVEIDAKGQITVDHEPIVADALIPKLRAARESTGRTAIILMADNAAKHKVAIKVIEAANELGLSTRLGRAGGGGEGLDIEPGG